MSKLIVPVLFVVVLVGCEKVAEPTKPLPASHPAESDAQVLIERVGEQVVGVRASKGDVKVLTEVPPATENEYRATYGEAPKRYLFAQVDMTFYTYGLNGMRVKLQSRPGEDRR